MDRRSKPTRQQPSICAGCRAGSICTLCGADHQFYKPNREFPEYYSTTQHHAPNDRGYMTAFPYRPAARQEQNAKIPESSAQHSWVRTRDTDRSDGWNLEVHRRQKKVHIELPSESRSSQASQHRDVTEKQPRNVNVNIKHSSHHHYHYHNHIHNHGNSRSAQPQTQISYESKCGETRDREETHREERYRAKSEKQGSSRASGFHLQQSRENHREETRGREGRHREEKHREKHRVKNEGKDSERTSDSHRRRHDDEVINLEGIFRFHRPRRV
ncbi:hypothetical protein F4678DRAFT_395892 [Xylaria arbuscula]|nr:hypothetical protein F4678DRAFT_395892 [Xylaria arbuscula]